MIYQLIIVLLFCIITFLYVKSSEGGFGLNILFKLLNRKRYKVIRNIEFLSKNGEKITIDYFIVSQYGIFIICVKDLKGYIVGMENDEFWKQFYKNKEIIVTNPKNYMNQIIRETNDIINKNFSKVMFIPIILIKDAKLDVYCGSMHVVNPHKLMSLIKRYRYIWDITHSDILEIVERMNSVNIKVQNIVKNENTSSKTV